MFNLLIVALAASAFAQETPALFKDATAPKIGRNAIARSIPGMEILRRRFVEVDRSAFASSNRRFRLNLFNDLSFDVQEQRSYASGDTVIRHGKISGMEHGYVVTAITGDIISANVNTDAGVYYQLRHVEGSLHVVEELNIQPQFAPDDNVAVSAADPLPRKELDRLASSVTRNAVGDVVVDVLVAYTANARDAAGGTAAIENKIQLAVGGVNQVYANSNVGIQLRLVRMMLVNYTEVAVNNALGALQGSTDGNMDEIHAARDAYGADLVSLWINGSGASGSAVGIANTMTSLTTAFDTAAFSVVEQTWGPAPGYTFAHELGHNMGAQHERAGSVNNGLFPYSRAYQATNVVPSFTTVMFSTNCGSCNRVPYYSNPNVFYNGAATGVGSTEAESADNALTLNTSRSVVAAFRSPRLCQATVNPASATHSSPASTNSFSVSIDSSCVWNASTADAWISITSGTSGTGNGTVAYSFTANNGPTRSGTINVGNTSFSVTQTGQGTCAYSLFPPSNFLGFAAQPGSFNVNTTAGCPWSASTTAPWITITSGSGNGSGSVAFTMTENTTAISRVASINAGGQIFTLTQGGGTGPQSQLNFLTNPPSLPLTIDGIVTPTPTTVNWIQGTTHTVAASNAGTTSPTRYNFASWDPSPYFTAGQTGASRTIVTPVLGEEVFFTANFAIQYLLTTNVNPPAGGYLSIAPGSLDGYYNPDIGVQLTAIANPGYQFTGWTGDSSTTNIAAFRINSPKTVTANFSSTSATTSITVTSVPAGLSLTIDGVAVTTPRVYTWPAGSVHTIAAPINQGSASTRNNFLSWSQGGAASQSITVPANAITYSATYQTQHQLTTSVSGPGTVSAAPSSPDGFYNQGTSVTLTANPSANNQFLSWSGALSGATSPSPVAMDGPKSVTATFGTASSGITIATVPPGLSITVDGQSYTAPQTFNWNAGSAHTIGANSPQGSGATRQVFSTWSDGGAVSHSINAPATASTYTATFQTQNQLVLNVNGPGSIAANPPSADGFYNQGTSVQLTANPTAGNQFSTWGGAITGTANPSSVVMDGPKSATATFLATSSPGITIASVPAGLQVSIDGITFTTPQTVNWAPGSSHTIAAPSPQGVGTTRQVFASWSNGGAATQTINAPGSDTTYTATFVPQYRLTLSINGPGTVTANPPSSDGFYGQGASVQLTAAPTSGSQFTGWSGALTGNASPATITLDSAKSVTATFGTASATGYTITSNPVGLQINVDGQPYTTPQTFNWPPISNHFVGTAQVQGSNGTRYTFSSWSDGGSLAHTITTPENPSTFTVNYTTEHQLTVATNGSGTVGTIPVSGDGYYTQGASVQLTANPSSGVQLTSWGGALSGSNNPATVVMDGPKSVTANFGTGPIATSYTVTSSPVGLTVTVDGQTYVTPKIFEWTPSSTHTISAVPTQGSESVRQSFVSWSNGGTPTQTITAPVVSTTYTANYVAQYLLAVSVTGSGTFAINSPPGTCTNGYCNPGTVVQISATPSGGSVFTGFSGALTGATNPTALIMDGPKAVVANFASSQGGTTIATVPAGLNIVVDGTSYVAPQTFPWTAGTTHTISAPATQGSTTVRNVFASWSDSGALSHTVTAPAAGTFTANFVTQYALTAIASPSAFGTVSVSPSATDGFYSTGTTVQLTAQPGSLYKFTEWTGSLTGTTNPSSVVMSAPRNVTANFATIACSYTLSQSEAVVAASGDIRSVVVTTSSACPWTAASNSQWLQVLSGAQVTGVGAVRFNVAPNPNNTQRSGILTIAGVAFNIAQSANSCTFTLTNPGFNLAASGGSFQLPIETAATCQWTATKSASWITFTSPVNGSGSGVLNVSADPNTGTVPRTVTINIGGVALHFIQKIATPAAPTFDVGVSNFFYDYIALLLRANVADLCGTDNFCPDADITRASMAVFLVKSLAGETFTYSQTPYFTDVPASHPQFAFIQKLQELGVTNGCATNRYCPSATVTREQMAAFVVRAKLGIRYDQTFPYPASAPFTDVPNSSIFYAYIQKLRELGVTTGCSATTFCPDSMNTRGQMAAFIARSFF